MNKQEAIQMLADWIAEVEIYADAEPEDGAEMLLEYMEREMGIIKPWETNYEGH